MYFLSSTGEEPFHFRSGELRGFSQGLRRFTWGVGLSVPAGEVSRPSCSRRCSSSVSAPFCDQKVKDNWVPSLPIPSATFHRCSSAVSTSACRASSLGPTYPLPPVPGAIAPAHPTNSRARSTGCPFQLFSRLMETQSETCTPSGPPHPSGIGSTQRISSSWNTTPSSSSRFTVSIRRSLAMMSVDQSASRNTSRSSGSEVAARMGGCGSL